jgi:Mce-associated membrane protein
VAADGTGAAGKTAEAVGETTSDAGETARDTDETADETDETTGDIDETPGDADETAEAADDPAEATAGETGETADETPEETAEAADGAGDTAGTGSGSGAGRVRLAALILGAVTVALGTFGVWATLAAHSLRASAAPQNTALTDGAATSAVKRQIVSAVNTVFSYSYTDTAATRHAAQSLLTGPAIQQYNTYFALVTKDAPTQKLVVTTKVTNSGVELLTGNRARVLIFANQQDTRMGTKQTSYAGALFAVTAVHQGNRWKIENIDTFNGQE